MARRSARLSKADQSSTDVNKPLPKIPQLDSVNEDDEIDATEDMAATPRAETNTKKQLKKKISLSTPKTEPRPAKSEMPADPKTIHQTTMPPDSGMKLGFVDISSKRQSAAAAQNTPSRSNQKTTQPATAPPVSFTFASESVLSNEAQQMMETVREEAARIKAEMRAQKDLQDQKDGEADSMFAGRKIARPKAKVGRFSDVHMAEFKKMDSIANHPSSFRARLGYAAPTSQSLKRSPSKAGLDEPQRPRTAGKGTPGRAPPPFTARKSSESPFKSIPQPVSSDRLENTAPAKRVRRSETEDVSSSRPREVEISKPSGIPKSVTTNSLFSPTKSSLARTQSATTSPAKASMLPRSQTVSNVRNAGRMSINRTTSAVSRFTSKLLEAQQESRKNSPLLSRSKSINDLSSKTPTLAPSSTTAPPSSFSSKLPTFSGLKSILRSPRKEAAILAERPNTPKRPNTSAGVVESPKKVDFTPSVKSRYAVKMTNNSPSPVKLAQSMTPDRKRGPVVPFDPAAYVVHDGQDDDWEDASDESIEYPDLPPLSAEPSPRVGPVTHTVAQKAKETGARESKEFKSIFTTLHHPSRPTSSGSLTSVSSGLSRPSSAIPQPPHMAGRVIAPLGRASRPSTIRRVRSSGSNEVIQPFEDTEVTTMAHGLPAKKRRRESQYFDTQESAEESKENISVPDQWKDSNPAEDEGAKRAKKVKTLDFKDIEANEKQASPQKKSAAREAAARNARERKSMAPGQSKANSIPAKGAITMSRLQMLSQPKHRD